MKKNVIALSLLAGAAFISSAQAADGTINFTGTIIDAACTVTPATAAQNVALGTVNASGFSAAGDTQGATRFDIVLTQCPAALTSATIKFDGLTHANNRSILALSGAGTLATGVGVAIFEDNNTALIPVATASAPKTLNAGADTTFSYIAKYMATAGTVTPGPANAVSDFTIAYN
ncbi:fimbrial protein [Pantoea agglomerans]